MSSRHGLLGATIFAVFASIFVLPAFGQDKEADQAKALLERGIAQYEALKFREAKATLLKVNAETLSDTDKAVFNEHLSKVDTAIRAQLAARETLAAAQDALKANKLTEAKNLFAKAAACDYLPPALRNGASRQAALITKKQQAVEVAARSKPKMPAVGPAVAFAAPRPDVRPKRAADNPNNRALNALAARRAKARELLAAGKAALDENRPAKAAKLFRDALRLDPDLEEAKKQLKFAEGLLGRDEEAPALTRLERRYRIARQRANLEIAKALGRSNEIVARADKDEHFKGASDAAQVAMDILVTNKELYTTIKSYRDKRTLIESQLKYVALKRGQWQRKVTKRQEEEVRDIEKKRLADQREQKRRKIDTLIGRARALKAGRRFKQALEEVERVLTLDPKNQWAGEQKETLAQFIMLMEHKDVVKTRNSQTQLLMIDLKRSEIPWWKELTYPQDWRELTSRRLKHGVTATIETAEDRKVRQRLKEHIRELNFEDVELEDVIQFLRDVSGVNIYVKWSALAAAGIQRTTTVNIRLQEVTLEKALKVVLEDVGASAPLGYVVDAGVITISTKDDLSTKTITRVYDIRDLIIRIPNFRGRRLDLTSDRDRRERREDRDFFEPGIDQDRDRRRGDGDLEEEEEDLSMQEVVDDIVELIKETIAPDTWANTNEVGITALRGQLVITQTAENHQRIIDLLGQLREARAIQVSIETRFIQVESGFLERIGFEFDILINANDRNNLHRWTGAGGTNPLTMGSRGTGAAHDLGDLVSWAHELGGGQIGLDIAGDTMAVPTALSIDGAFLEDIQVNFLIQATQAHAMTRVLTAPRITLFNGQRAFVSVTRERTYVSEFELTTTPVLGTADVVRQEIDIETEILRTGTMLDVRATISDDRRYVTLTLRPQISTGDTTPFIVSGGDAAFGTDFETTMQLPDLTISEIQTSVSVPDGGTILLGGLKRAAENEREIGVPLLNKIPILNRLFTNQGTARDNETLLILVKPKIIIQREEEELAFP